MAHVYILCIPRDAAFVETKLIPILEKYGVNFIWYKTIADLSQSIPDELKTCDLVFAVGPRQSDPSWSMQLQWCTENSIRVVGVDLDTDLVEADAEDHLAGFREPHIIGTDLEAGLLQILDLKGGGPSPEDAFGGEAEEPAKEEAPPEPVEVVDELNMEDTPIEPPSPEPEPILSEGPLDDFGEEDQKKREESKKLDLPPPPPRPITPAPSIQPSVIAPPSPKPVHPTPPASAPATGASVVPPEERIQRSNPSAEEVNFSSYYPVAGIPGQTYALLIYAHLNAAADQVRVAAQTYLQMMGGQQMSTTADKSAQIDPGAILTFVPILNGATATPPAQNVIWNAPYQQASFFLKVSESARSLITGAVQVFQGPLVIGEIPISIKVATTQTAVPGQNSTTSSEMKRYDPIFASYSHRDTPIMEYFRTLRSRTGQKMLVDIYDLRAGDHWNPRLLELIDQSAVFQLFWSPNSAASKYCEQEWRHALKYEAIRTRFIQPVWWEEPMTPVPHELSHIHFQRVPIPAMTRLQMLGTKIRNTFRRD